MTRSALIFLLALLMLPWAVKAQSPGTLQVQEIDSPNGEIKLGSPVVGFQDKGGQVYNVKAYGAKGDGEIITDGTIHTSSTALTSATGHFASGDVGKDISVLGAGPSGATLTTKIASFTSSTQINLSNAASTTVTSAKVAWGTDDSSEIRSAISAMPGCREGNADFTHCGRIYFPNGRYYIGSTIPIDSPYVHMEGESTGSVVLDSHIASGDTIDWTSKPFNPGQDNTNASGLFYLTIEGVFAASGVNGLRTNDISGFKARGVSIVNFTSGANWIDETDSYWNERFDVNATLANGHFNLEFYSAKSGSYNPTYGYGNWVLKINVNAGQYGIYFSAPSGAHIQFDNSTGNIIENVAGNGVCIQFEEATTTVKFYGLFHCEQSNGKGGHGISGAASRAYFSVLDMGGLSPLITASPGVAAGFSNFSETYSQLPSCASTTNGWTAHIRDSSVVTFNAAASGGGSGDVRVRCNGTNWVVY